MNLVSMSHPVWVRGLKLLRSRIMKLIMTSHPVWVRGLKQFYGSKYPNIRRRTLYGCVD